MLVGLSGYNKSLKKRLLQSFLRNSGLKYKITEPKIDVDELSKPRYKRLMLEDAYPDLEPKSDNLYVVYGLHGNTHIVRKLFEQKINCILIDNGYLNSVYLNPEKVKYSVTLNNTRLNRIVCHEENPSPLRYTQRKSGGTNIILCKPSEIIASVHGFSISDWLERAKENLHKLNKWFVVREKAQKDKQPFKEVLKDAALVVTAQSLTGMEAIQSGVPVVCDDFSLSKPVGNPIHTEYSNLDEIQYPSESLFHKWINSLRMNEFDSGMKNAYKKVMELQS
jgi:hypothetical protein